jgi:hypothetical protein
MKKLDQIFQYIKENISVDDLWKIGVFYSKIQPIDFKSNNVHGIEIEEIFREKLNAKKITEKVITKKRNDGGREVHDFISIGGMKIQNKTVIRNGGLFKHFGGLKSDKHALKIIDTSRRNTLNIPPQKIINEYIEKLTEDLNILMYVYDIKNGRGCLCLTSLFEMCESILGSLTIKNLSLLISFNNNCHYFLDRFDVYECSKHHNRLIEFSLPDQHLVDDYIKSKHKLQTISEKVL